MPSYAPGTLQKPNAIRIFADAQVEESMKRMLDKLPKKKRGAVVMYADQSGVHGAIYGRRKGRFFGLLPPGEWSYVGTLGTTYNGKLSGMAAVGYSW